MKDLALRLDRVDRDAAIEGLGQGQAMGADVGAEVENRDRRGLSQQRLA